MTDDSPTPSTVTKRMTEIDLCFEKLLQKIRENVFSTVDCVTMDEGCDDAFIEKVLFPALTKLQQDSNYTFGPVKQKTSRFRNWSGKMQHAQCQRVMYTGPSVDKKRTLALLDEQAKAMKLDDAGAVIPASPSVYLQGEMPDKNERNKNMGGLIIITRAPFTPTREYEREYEDKLTDAARHGRFVEVITLTRHRTRSLFITGAASTFEFDRATMTTLLCSLCVGARTLKIDMPYSMRYACNAAAAAYTLSPHFEIAMKVTAVEQIVNQYLDIDLINFYATVLRNEEFVKSVGFAHAVDTLRENQEQAAAKASFYDEFADEIDEENGSQEADDEDNDDDEDDDDDDTEQDSQPELSQKIRRFATGKSVSVLSKSRSINSRVSSATSTVNGATKMKHTGEAGFKNTPFRALEGDTFEFADRLRGTEKAQVPITSAIQRELCKIDFIVRTLPPRRLIERFEIGLTVAVRLVDLFYGGSMQFWNPRDYFYLYSLTELAYRTRTNNPKQLSAETGDAIQALVNVNLSRSKKKEEQLALADRSYVQLYELVLATLFSTTAQQSDTTVYVKYLFGPQLMMNRVLESFQTQSDLSMRQRRTRATFVKSLLVEQAELDEFLKQYALYSYHLKIKALLAEAEFDPITYRILRFESSFSITPLALVSTLRAYGARDGDDALVVWTPATIHPKTGPIYVLMRRSVWVRITAAAIPRAVAEQRALGNVARSFLLMAPSLLRALNSPDPAVAIDALSAIQALFCRCPRALPMQWQADDPVCIAEQRRTIMLLRKVATTVQYRVQNEEFGVRFGRNSNAGEMITALRRQSGETRYNSIFAVVQVALSGTRSFLFMSAERARKFLNSLTSDDDDLGIGLDPSEQTPKSLSVKELKDQKDLKRLGEIIRKQLAATRQQANRRQLRDEADGVAAIERRECLCGVQSEKCERVARALDMLQLPKSAIRGVLLVECCNCARVPLAAKNNIGDPIVGEKRRRTVVVKSMCERCQERQIISAVTAPDDYIALYDPVCSVNIDGGARQNALDPERIIELLSTPDLKEYLYALRIGTRSYDVCKTVLPRNDYKNKKKDYVDPPTIAGAKTKKPTTTTTTTTATTTTNDEIDVDKFARKGVQDVVEATKLFADKRIRKAQLQKKTHSHQHNDLMALLVQIEMLSMLNHEALADVNNQYQKYGTLLNPLSEDQLAALAADTIDFDANGLLTATLKDRTMLFPLCESAIVESTGIWYQTAASIPDQQDIFSQHKRVARVLYAGRMPRPMLHMPQCFSELVFGNWYNGAEIATCVEATSSTRAEILNEQE